MEESNQDHIQEKEIDIDKKETLNDFSNKLNIKNSCDLPIQIGEPIKKEGLKSYVNYTIILKGTNETIFRRYSDFFALRKKLTERWPGVFIPNIPPKKTMGNLEEKVIEARKKLLNTFCIKLSKFPHIFASKEMNLFTSNCQDVKKAFNNLGNQNYEELYLKYKEAFPDFYEVSICIINI
jgi:sorting nexin-1/2